MKYLKVDPADYPLVQGESWWFIRPNDGESELVLPPGAMIMCLNEIEEFTPGDEYRILSVDKHYGWISLGRGDDTVVELPPYVLARYFDVEPYVRGTRRPLASAGDLSPRFISRWADQEEEK